MSFITFWIKLRLRFSFSGEPNRRPLDFKPVVAFDRSRTMYDLCTPTKVSRKGQAKRCQADFISSAGSGRHGHTRLTSLNVPVSA